MLDISRLVGMIYWYKTTGLHRKDEETTRERCYGCHQCQDSWHDTWIEFDNAVSRKDMNSSTATYLHYKTRALWCTYCQIITEV